MSPIIQRGMPKSSQKWSGRVDAMSGPTARHLASPSAPDVPVSLLNAAGFRRAHQPAGRGSVWCILPAVRLGVFALIHLAKGFTARTSGLSQAGPVRAMHVTVRLIAFNRQQQWVARTARRGPSTAGATIAVRLVVVSVKCVKRLSTSREDAVF